MGKILNIGFDDTDSPKGMCTTYLAYKLVCELKREKVKFLDFPRLVRFNPNIPWKTRGNGAVSLRIQTEDTSKIKEIVIKFIKKYSDLKNGANPGVVFLEKPEIPPQFTKFSREALWRLVSRSEARKFIYENGLDSFFIGNGQGLVGAIGAIGYKFDDCTLELLSYRDRSHFGKKRIIDASSVKKMQQTTYPYTFNSYDATKDRVLFAPHGPDPVFYGIRGENAKSLIMASKLIKSREEPTGYMIFKSNQGTNDHLKNELDVTKLKPYSSGTVTGVIVGTPQLTKGGHVNFHLLKDGVRVSCYVYRPTGITKQAMELIDGDHITVGGGVRRSWPGYGRTLNVEFFKVLRLQKKTISVNPACPSCQKRMKSKGKNQGFECARCKTRASSKVVVEVPRKIKKRLYIPVPSAHRHLSRPYQRIGVKNKVEFDHVRWFCQKS